VLGRVAAGAPIGADADIHSRLLLDPSIFSRVPDYMLRVQGDSMIEDGILDGDLVGVQRNPEALNGQIVVARLDGEVTIKRFERVGDRFACCRATRRTSRSSSKPTRTWPSKGCSAVW
jgi:repressor LexA